MKTRGRSTGAIAFLAAVCMLLGTMGTFAADGFVAVDPVETNAETGITTISGLLNTAEEDVALMVFLPGTVTDGILKTPDKLADKLYYTDTTKADKDGEFSFTFDMTQGPNGNRGATGVYPFLVACGEVKTGTVSYANRDELLSAIQAIAACKTATDVQTALTPARAVILSISADLATDAQALTDADAIATAYGAVVTAVSAEGFDATKVASAKVIRSAFEEAAAFTLLRSTTDATKLQTYIEKYNTLYGFETGTDSDYAKITAAENRAIVYQALASDGDFTSKEAAQASFAKAVLVGYINDITATGTLLTVLRDNAATLEEGLSVTLNFTAYDALATDSQRASVMNAVVAATMTSAKAVVEQFNASITQYANAGGSGITTTPTTSGGHSGGGGGGGSWTGLPTTTDTITNPDNGNDVQNKTGFADLAGCEWAWEAIADLQNRGVINGKDIGIFDPNGNVTRAEFVKMIVKAFGLATNGGGQVFEDVSLQDWYYDAVSVAATCGIVNGYGSKFAPNASITREDMAVILMRAAQYVDKMPTTGTVNGFADAGTISEYAREAVGIMQAGGIINGMEDGTFRPQQNATRAEACKMLYALMQ